VSLPIIRTGTRDAVIQFLEYLLEGFRAGHISGYTSMFEVTGVGRHCVTTDDPSAIPFDLSDVTGDSPALTSPETPSAKAALDPEEPKV
jgi:hypothetical protein